MKTRFLPLLAFIAAFAFAGCGDAEKRTDGTAGEAVSEIDEAADKGGVEADATVIDNDAGPTVSVDSDTLTAADTTSQARP